MRVKIGNTWYDSLEQPICIEVNSTEKGQIQDMDMAGKNKAKYASFPDDSMSKEEMLAWMDTNREGAWKK